MNRRNWLDLSRKLVDRFDLDITLNDIETAIAQAALNSWGQGVLATLSQPLPLQVTLSGISLGGTLSPGFAYDPAGHPINVAASTNFSLTADPTNPRKALLVLRYKKTGDTPVPKPSDPISTVSLNLHDDFDLVVILGTPAVSPSYPAALSNDVIVKGFTIPAGATLGTTCTTDDSVRMVGGHPALNISLTQSFYKAIVQASVEQFLEELDYVFQYGIAGLGADNTSHDSGFITCNSGGTAGHKVTITGVDFVVGSGAGQVPAQANANDLALTLARTIRNYAPFKNIYLASAANGKVALYAVQSGAIGGSLAVTGATFSVSGAALTGNGIRKTATAAGLAAQIDQLDKSSGSGGSLLRFGLSGPVDGLSLPSTQLLVDRLDADLTLASVYLFVKTAGSSGTLEVDVQYQRGASPFASIFSTRPTLSFSAGNLGISNNGVLAVTSLLKNDIVRLDLIQAQSGMDGFDVKFR